MKMVGTTKMTSEILAMFMFLGSIGPGQQQFGDVKRIVAESGTQSKKGRTVDGSLSLSSESKEIVFTAKDKTSFAIKCNAVKSLLYERTSRPRYVSGILIAWPLLFTKGKKHFLTVQYSDESGGGAYALFQLDKGNYQLILAAVEAETGIKVERAEEH